jgi:hypothetical protein
MWTIRSAEPWTLGNVVGGLVLLVALVGLAVYGIRVTLRR